jgi:hypothetical protein
MRWGTGIVVVALAACNGAFDLDETALDTRPDRDGDHIPDEEDDCITSPGDLAIDGDGDGALNTTDSCPYLVNSADADGDGVDNACDIYPTTAGDRHRCTNAFQDRLLTVSFFESRGPDEFAVARGFIIGPPNADAIAAEPLIRDTGTSTFDALTSSVAEGQPYIISLLLSAADTPSTSDLGCLVIVSLQGTTITTQGTTQEISSGPGVPRGSKDAVFLRGIVQPGKAGYNVACFASYGDTTIGAYAHYDGVVQRQGFSVPGGGAVIGGYTIEERDDQPTLPGL